MESVGAEVHGGELHFGDLDAKRIGVFIEFGIHLEAGFSRCGPYCLDNRSETTQWFSSQLMVMKEKRRCSILFHLLVPGGRWQTVMGMPSVSAKFWSSIFQRRTRWPLLPPPS